MKKLSFILISLILTSCSKHSVAPAYNTKIQYTFTSSRPASYKLYYSNANGDIIDSNIFTSSWSKTIYTDSIKWSNKNNGVAIFELNNMQQTSPAITGTMNLFINDKLRNTGYINFSNVNDLYEIGAVVLKQ